MRRLRSMSLCVCYVFILAVVAEKFHLHPELCDVGALTGSWGGLATCIDAVSPDFPAVTLALGTSVVLPLLLFLPLMPLRKRLRDVKMEALDSISDRMTRQMPHLNGAPRSCDTWSCDEVTQLRMMKELHDLVSGMSVWPFQSRNIGMFLATYAPTLVSLLMLLVPGK